MGSFRQSDARGSEPNAVPPFWLSADVDGVTIVDPPVIEVAQANWTWAFYLVSRELNDGARTREVVQDVAVEVTKRLKEDSAVARNLDGYFRTAVIRYVRALAIRESRIAYQGSIQDLEANHQPTTPDWTQVFERRAMIESLIPYMSHPVRQMLHYRLLDYSWKQIAERLALSEKQAKSRFYYGVRQAYEELIQIQAKRARKGELEERK